MIENCDIYAIFAYDLLMRAQFDHFQPLNLQICPRFSQIVNIILLKITNILKKSYLVAL